MNPTELRWLHVMVSLIFLLSFKDPPGGSSSRVLGLSILRSCLSGVSIFINKNRGCPVAFEYLFNVSMLPKFRSICLCWYYLLLIWKSNLTGYPGLNLLPCASGAQGDEEVILPSPPSASGYVPFNRGMRSVGTGGTHAWLTPFKSHCNCDSNLLEASAKSSSKKSPTWKGPNTRSAELLPRGKASGGFST